MPDLPDKTQYTPFRLSEKHFKNRAIKGSLPNLHHQGVLDLSRPEREEDDDIWKGGWWGPEESELDIKRRIRKGKERERGERGENDLEGLRKIRLGDGRVGWVVAEGCILIPQYLSPSAQLTLLQSALSSYTLPPNPLSLSTHYDLPPNLFDLYINDPSQSIKPIFSTLPPEIQARIVAESQSTTGGSRKLNETESGSKLGYEEILARSKAWDGDKPSIGIGEKTVGELMEELRWANLGWIYRWTTKSYDFTPETPIPFPEPLAELCAGVVKDIPWKEVFEDTEVQAEGNVDEAEWSSWKQDYRPDTGIVNFYQMSDTLMGHVDRAELDPSRPLVSISLGHSAIFLLGSQSRSTKPKPIILRSGDVLIMSGKGRQFYHGIPRIMENSLPGYFRSNSTDSIEMAAIKTFISTARVNINARQVFPPDFERPSS